MIGRDGGRSRAVRTRHADTRRTPADTSTPDRERDSSLFDQHHDGHGRHALRHRVDAEQRLLRHRDARLERLRADGLQIRELAVARDRGDRAGNLPLLHELLSSAVASSSFAADSPTSRGSARGSGSPGAADSTMPSAAAEPSREPPRPDDDAA